ncbi:hypothetical protein HGRIS_008090 [Hohenbuehelia grisea]|uniref:Uncharacterized protein n=1 Tax=Hohenbuehelia grisea TaxID=104357 RepID=A0ABR3J6W7_9AGAR
MLRLSEEAVEYGELDTFLRLKDSWNPDVDEDRPAPEAKPIGVPGAMMPLQMTPEHLRTKILATPTASPLKGKGKPIPVNKRQNEIDVGNELVGFGLQGVKVTDDELLDLIADLGLDGDDAADLVGGLSGSTGGSGGKKPEGQSVAAKEKESDKPESDKPDVSTKADEESATEASGKAQAVEGGSGKGAEELKGTDSDGAKVSEEPSPIVSPETEK